jgi:hypothetical protein
MLLMFLSACVQEVELQLQSKLKLPSALYLDQMQNSNAHPIDFMVLDSANQSIQDAKIDSSMVEVDMHIPQIDQMLVNQDQMMMIQDQMIDDQMMMVDMMMVDMIMVDMMPPIEPQFPIPPDCDENHLDACLQIGAKINELNYVNERTTNTFIEIYNPHQYQLDEHLQVDFYRMDLVYDRNEHYLDVNDLGSINDCLAVENHLYYTCLLSDIENHFEFSRFFDFILVILSYQNIAIDALFIYHDSMVDGDFTSFMDSNISNLVNDFQIPNALSIQFTNQFDQNQFFSNDQSISRCPLADDPRQVEFQSSNLSFGLANICQ